MKYGGVHCNIREGYARFPGKKIRDFLEFSYCFFLPLQFLHIPVLMAGGSILQLVSVLPSYCELYVNLKLQLPEPLGACPERGLFIHLQSKGANSYSVDLEIIGMPLCS